MAKLISIDEHGNVIDCVDKPTTSEVLNVIEIRELPPIEYVFGKEGYHVYRDNNVTVEYRDRPLTEAEEIHLLKQEKGILAQSVYELADILELILTGGITE